VNEMSEYETTETAKKSSFKDTLVAIPSTISAKLPTMDKSLDKYFDSHMSAIVEEWGLVTQHDLDEIDRRLQVSGSGINKLETGRARIEKRAADLDAEIRKMEGK
jgi:hypothetical protein